MVFIIYLNNLIITINLIINYFISLNHQDDSIILNSTHATTLTTTKFYQNFHTQF